MPSQYSHISSTRCVIGQHRQKARSTLEPLRMFRQAMRAVAGSGRALELNVGGPIRPWIAQWWSEEGGRAITLASDAHTRRVWPATSSRLGSRLAVLELKWSLARAFGRRVV